MPKNVPSYSIGLVLQAATSIALERLRDSHIIYQWKLRDYEKLPDFMVTDNKWRIWEIECKNWQTYRKPTRIAWMFDKNFSTNLRILIGGAPFHLTAEVKRYVKLLYTEVIILGEQVTKDNVGVMTDIVYDKLLTFFERHGSLPEKS